MQKSAGRLEMAKELIMKVLGGTKKYMNPMNVKNAPYGKMKAQFQSLRDPLVPESINALNRPELTEEALKVLGGGGTIAGGAGLGAAGIKELVDKDAEAVYRQGFVDKCAAANIDAEALVKWARFGQASMGDAYRELSKGPFLGDESYGSHLGAQLAGLPAAAIGGVGATAVGLPGLDAATQAYREMGKGTALARPGMGSRLGTSVRTGLGALSKSRIALLVALLTGGVGTSMLSQTAAMKHHMNR